MQKKYVKNTTEDAGRENSKDFPFYRALGSYRVYLLCSSCYANRNTKGKIVWAKRTRMYKEEITNLINKKCKKLNKRACKEEEWYPHNIQVNNVKELDKLCCLKESCYNYYDVNFHAYAVNRELLYYQLKGHWVICRDCFYRDYFKKLETYLCGGSLRSVK